jgi:hypothetical protein
MPSAKAVDEEFIDSVGVAGGEFFWRDQEAFKFGVRCSKADRSVLTNECFYRGMGSRWGGWVRQP